MTLRDMTPDELELFEEEIVQGSDRDRPERHRPSRAVEKELDEEIRPGDEDGLPDGPAKHRVPS